MPDTRPLPPAWFRWTVLVVISFAMFGNYYVYDSISPIADLLESQLGFSDSQIGLLNAIYSVPNIGMVLVGGIIVDRIGVKRATLLFGTLCFAGAALTASSGTLPLMALGRLLFGLGAESLIVSVTTAIAKWFRGKELSFAFGVNLTIARLGSYLALTSPSWAAGTFDSWRGPLLIAVGVSTICVVGPLIYWLQENVAVARYDLGAAGPTDKVEWSQLFRFDRSYVYVVLLCVTFYSAIIPFQTFAVKFFQEAHGTTREMGGSLSGMLTLFAMVMTPVFGIFADKVGRRALLMMFGSLLLVPVYLMMAYTRMPQLMFGVVTIPVFDWFTLQFPFYLPMIMMGVAFSLIPAVMWPSVAYLVDQPRLGTAYGLMTMIQNIGLAGFNFVIGWANDYSAASAEHPAGYTLGMWIFSTLGLLGFVFAWLLRRAETGPGARGLETIRAGS